MTYLLISIGYLRGEPTIKAEPEGDREARPATRRAGRKRMKE